MTATPQLPPATTVSHNAWHLIERPELGAWTPTRTVSIVLPAFECQGELELTLAGLASQTYPRSLMQAVIVDDGSEPALEVPRSSGDLDVVLLRQPNTGFGSGRARNAAAAAAEGEILILLDADMLPAPWQIEAHARWHHHGSDLVTLGERRHVDVTGLTAEDVLHAAAPATPEAMEALFAGRPQSGVPWIERFLERTQRLRRHRLDLFRIFTGGNAGMLKSTWDAVGGMHVFGVRGTEDTELGYRLFNHGAVFVPDAEAMNWHQGMSFFQSEAKAQVKYDRTPVLANHIPVGGFRRRGGNRAYAVPAVAVLLDVRTATGEVVWAAVDAVLEGAFTDVRVVLTVDEAYPETKYLRDAFEADSRVEVRVDDATPPYELAGRSPFFVLLPDAAAPGEDTIGRLVARLSEDALGAIHLTVPGVSPRQAMVHAYATGASRRAARVAAADDGDWQVALGSVFNETWAAGADLGVRTHPAPASE